MKNKTLFLLAAIAAALSGCVVSSVAPFYTEKDVVFEPALVGNWVKPGDNSDYEVWKFEKKTDSSYRFTWITSEKATLLEAHAFKLQGQLFLDMASTQKDWDTIPPHFLLKVSQVGPSLRLTTLSHEWLKQAVSKEPGLVAHHAIGDDPNDKRVVLTANTAELQTFVLKHLKTAEAWDEEFQLTPEKATPPTAPKDGKK